MQSGGEEAYECRVRWTELRGRGRVPQCGCRLRTFGVGDESPSFVAASIGLKIFGPGANFPGVLFRQLEASSAPSHPITINLHPVIQQHIYTHCMVSLPCDCDFNIIYSLRIYCVFASRASSSPAIRLEWMLLTNKLALMRHLGDA